MAIYEYYCPTCKTKFEQRKSMSDASAASNCAKGHRAERALSLFAAPRTGGDVALAEFDGGGGGCCGGGGCACSN
jgi:putative FmdB family regulatory protein